MEACANRFNTRARRSVEVSFRVLRGFESSVSVEESAASFARGFSFLAGQIGWGWSGVKKVGVPLEHPLIAFITSGTAAAQWYSEEDSKEEEEEKCSGFGAVCS